MEQPKRGDWVTEQILAGPEAEAVEILCRCAKELRLTPVEHKRLAQLAGKRAGVGERVAAASLKEAKVNEWQEKAEERQEIAEGQSLRIGGTVIGENPRIIKNGPRMIKGGPRSIKGRPQMMMTIFCATPRLAS